MKKKRGKRRERWQRRSNHTDVTMQNPKRMKKLVPEASWVRSVARTGWDSVVHLNQRLVSESSYCQQYWADHCPEGNRNLSCLRLPPQKPDFSFYTIRTWNTPRGQKEGKKIINTSFLDPNVYLDVKFSITSFISGNRGPYFQSLISTRSLRVSHPKRSDFLH